jgi:hydrogenase maturation factor
MRRGLIPLLQLLVTMAQRKVRAGRASIFRGKAKGVRVQGVLTREGAKSFEQHRKDLATLYLSITARTPAAVSDADVIEYLAVGVDRTREVLDVSAR